MIQSLQLSLKTIRLILNQINKKAAYHIVRKIFSWIITDAGADLCTQGGGMVQLMKFFFGDGIPRNMDHG